MGEEQASSSRDVVSQKNATNPLASKENKHRNPETSKSENETSGHNPTAPATVPGPCSKTGTHRALGNHGEVRGHTRERKTSFNIHGQLQTPGS